MYAEVQIRTVQPTTGEANMQRLRTLLLKNKGADSQYLSIFWRWITSSVTKRLQLLQLLPRRPGRARVA